MSKRVVIGALCGALWVLASGCSDDECRDEFDCREEGTAPPGQAWTCNADKKCELRPIQGPPEEDAGTGEDAGTQVDAGTDAGTEDAGTEVDAGTDAGTEMDAGVDAGMNVAKGEACTQSSDCQPGLRCEGTPTTCQAMHVAVTVASGGDTKAVAVRHDEATATVVELSESADDSRYPRWNPGGTAVAFVEGAAGTDEVRLVIRAVPPVAGQATVATDGADAGTEEFVYMEWEPSTYAAWVRRNGSSTSGISVLPPDGGAPVSATENGVFPSWASDGVTFAYSTNAEGLVSSSIGGSPAPITGGTTGSEPHFNRGNNVLLFLANPDNRSTTFEGDSFVTPLPKLYTIPAGGGTPQELAGYTAPAGSVDTVDSYIANPNWAPDGSWAAYVRAYYYRPASGDSVLCGGTSSPCGTHPGNIIFLRKVDMLSGAPVGAEIEFARDGTLPSFSPDGRFIAYINAGRLNVQQINPEDGSLVGTPVVHAQPTGVQTSRGDDHRPRWQPK